MAFIQLQGEPGFREKLGTSIGAGLGEGLQQLAQDRLGNLQRQQTAQGLGSMGFSPDQANQLAMLPQPILQQVLKQQQQQASGAQFADALSELLGHKPATSSGEPSPGQQAPRLLNERQAAELAKIGLQKEAADRGEKIAAFKETKEERKQIINDYKAAKQDLKDLDRLEDLADENKLDTPGYVEFLKRSGFDIPALMNPGSEEFNKITQNFMRNAKQYLGSRISNYELEQFLKTIPSLSQSPEGRQRVIANLKYITRAKAEYYNAYREIMEENKNIPPFDLSSQVEERSDKRMDKIADQFRKDLAKPVPPGQNKLITALQAAAGSVFGGIGKAIPGAISKIGEGALLGSGASALLK